jgi:hypothetical protein
MGKTGLKRLMLGSVASRIVTYMLHAMLGCKGFEELDERGFCSLHMAKDKKRCRSDWD